MKKLLIAAVAMTAVAFTSCNRGVKADMKTDVDTLAYELGVAQGEGLKQYMMYQLQVDSTQLSQFIKGMQEGAMNEQDDANDAYMKGLQVGGQIKQMAKGLSQDVYQGDSTKSISPRNILAGLIAVLKGETTESSQDAYQKFTSLMEPIQNRNLEKQFGDNKKAGEAYVAKYAKEDGVNTLEEGVLYKVLREGTGAAVNDTSKLVVAYVGRLIDGTVFDSSRVDNPFEVNMAMPRVIPGWVTALKHMREGAKWEVVIPQEQAYGKGNQGLIKPFSALIFDIEVKSVK